MRQHIRDLVANRIEDYLETECSFRDYNILSADKWQQGAAGQGSINLLTPTAYDLDDAIAMFVRDGYNIINIYV